MPSASRPVLCVVMDGVGERTEEFGNAVKAAKTPNLDKLREQAIYTQLFAHGTAVGMPSDSDLGNSEIGHNAIGAGRIFDQGAKLVQNALKSGTLFSGKCWQDLVKYTKSHNGTLHFIGLLSDGNVHSHEEHLFALLRHAKADGVKRIRIHPLLDGRDVGEKSAEIYVDRLTKVIAELDGSQCDVKVASGGGRMVVTMDRYEADWSIVERGWRAHVLGEAPNKFTSLAEAVSFFRRDDKLSDQYFPPFVIVDKGSSEPVGTINGGDGVVLFNFRGDRAVEICRAFTESENDFNKFPRQRLPTVFFAGMMEYDGDLKIPENYLVAPPLIGDTLSEYLVAKGKRQFACSETQKFGHVTYFWNGNRSGKMSETLEEYVEIPSDRITFDKKPEMKAREITDTVIDRMQRHTFDFARINYANGDMVGHTGVFSAAVKSVEVVDSMIGRLLDAAKATNTILLITADHGNCDDMFDDKETEEKYPNWRSGKLPMPRPKTAHSLYPVPLFVIDPANDIKKAYDLADVAKPTLANIANTVLMLMGLPLKPNYLPSLLVKKN